MTDVILVNPQDQPIGTMEKHQAHQLGQLHRAFSIFLWRQHNHNLELLIQQRHPGKYHSGGLWSNSCCSHPQPHQSLTEAANQRLNDELGIQDHFNFEHLGSFIYQAHLGVMTEHEYDHILAAPYSGSLKPNPQEVIATQWISWEQLQVQVKKEPDQYTVWLPACLEHLTRWIQSNPKHLTKV